MTIGIIGAELGRSLSGPPQDMLASLLAGARTAGGGLDANALSQSLADIARDDPETAKAIWSQVKPMLTPVQQGEVSGARVMLARASTSSTQSGTRSLPYLSQVHNEIRQEAANYPPKPGTEGWSAAKVVPWQLGRTDVFGFKAQWVNGYKDAINAAARQFDLPPGLVAGVAFSEVGGDPAFIDNVAYAVRGGQARDRTSFGDVSMQMRRAAETLGYGNATNLTETQRRVVLSSLENPQTNVFVAAKHLSDLRHRDFRGVPGNELTKGQVEVIATRFNRGPDLSLAQIKSDLDYGRDITKRWDHINSLIK